MAGLALAALAATAAAPGGAQSGSVRLVKVGEFGHATYVDDAPGAKRLLFVVEEAGRIRVVRRGKVLERPFLNISDRVRTVGYEEGLFSVAFAPNYRRSGRFFVYYTKNDGDNQVDAFKRSQRSPTRALERSRRTIIKLPHPGEQNHNGGQLQFGPDGYLYLGTGDGGGGCDPRDNAQDKGSLLGKILRIDPRARGGYKVPRGNPFVGRAGRDEIYARGLRNPWRFSFDHGRIAIGDVGESRWEEVNVETLSGAKGANFGWDYYEGTRTASCGNDERPASHQPPIHEYSHAGGRCSITGGYVVRDRRLPTLFGRYVYADFCADQIRSLVPRIDGARDDRSVGLSVGSITSFGEGRHNKVYVVSHGGDVFRLAPR